MVAEIINGSSIIQYKTDVDRMVIRRNRFLDPDIRTGKKIDYSCPAPYLGAFRRIDKNVVQPIVYAGGSSCTFVDAGLRGLGLISGVHVLGCQIERIHKTVFNESHRSGRHSVYDGFGIVVQITHRNYGHPAEAV